MAAWSYTQNFDSLNTAALSGQDSWTGTGAVNVQATSPRSGAKDAQSTEASSASVVRTITGVDSGDMYFSMKYTSSVSSNLEYIDSGGSFVTLVASAVSGTWYDLHIQFLSSTTFKIQWKVAGGSWSAFSGTRTYASSISSPVQLKYYGDLDANPYFIYFGLADSGSTFAVLVGFNGAGQDTGATSDLDEIGTTDPDAAVGPANLKTYNSLAKASIKTMNGLAIASVKTWNGLA